VTEPLEPDKLSTSELIRAASVVVSTLSMVVEDLRKEVKGLKVYGTQTRKLIVLVLVLFVGLGFGLWQSYQASQDALRARHAIEATQYSGCKFGNDSRIAQKRIWDAIFLAVVKPPPGETPKEKEERLAATAQVKALVEQAYATRDCGVVPG